MKARPVEDGGLPAHLRDWPAHDDHGLEDWFQERVEWAKNAGDPVLPLLRERRRRHLEAMEPVWAAYRAEHGEIDTDGAA